MPRDSSFPTRLAACSDCVFTRLCPTVHYGAPISDSFCAHTDPFPVDRLVIRGRYRTLSIIVVGLAAGDAPVESCPLLWGQEKSVGDHATESNGVFIVENEKDVVKDRCEHLDAFLPLGHLWEASETAADAKIHSILSGLDTNSSDFDAVKEDVVGFLSGTLWARDPSAGEASPGEGGTAGAKFADKIIDKIVRCLEGGEGSPYSALRLSALASVLVCASPDFIAKFEKKGGIDGLWTVLHSGSTSLESKFWSVLSFLVASCHQKGLDCLAGHAHTTKGEGSGFENLEQGLLGLTMQPGYASLALWATRVIQHLQVYNACKALKSSALEIAQKWKKDKGVAWEKIDKTLGALTGLRDTLCRIRLGKEGRGASSASHEIRVETFLGRQNLSMAPPADAIAVQCLLENKGMAALSTMLTILVSCADRDSAGELGDAKVDLAVATVVEICLATEDLKYFEVLLSRGMRECRAFCSALVEAKKLRANSDLSNLGKRWAQHVQSIRALDALTMRIHSEDTFANEKAVASSLQDLMSHCSQLYEMGGSCDSIMTYVVRFLVDYVTRATGEGNEMGELKQASRIHPFSVAALDLLYLLLSAVKSVDLGLVSNFVRCFGKSLALKPHRESFAISPYKLDSMCEVKAAISMAEEADLGLQRYMNECGSLNLPRTYGMMFAVKSTYTLMKESSLKSVDFPEFTQSLQKMLTFLHGQAMSIQNQQREAWLGCMSQKSCFYATSMIILRSLDACIRGVEACFEFILSVPEPEQEKMDLGGFSKAFVKSYDIILVHSGSLDSGEYLGVLKKLSAVYARCLRMWTVSKLAPSVAAGILGEASEGSIAFSVAKYLHPMELLRSIELINMVIPFDSNEYSLLLAKKANEHLEACASGISSILSQAAFFSFPGIKKRVVEFCLKVSRLGPNSARAVVSVLLDLLQQEYEILCEDQAEIKCAENLCNLIETLSRDPLCKKVMLEAGGITIMLSIFKQPLVDNSAIAESSLPLTLAEAIHNQCNTDICISAESPLYVRAVEDSPSIDEGANFVSTALEAMQSLSDKVMKRIVGTLVLLSQHIPGKVALKSGATQWKTNAYWTGEDSQAQEESMTAASALSSAARFLRSAAGGTEESQDKRAGLASAAEVLEGMQEEVGDDDDEEEEEAPQPADLEVRYREHLSQTEKSFAKKQGLELRRVLRDASFPVEYHEEEQALTAETEVQALNRWHHEDAQRKESLLAELARTREAAPEFGGKLTRDAEAGSGLAEPMDEETIDAKPLGEPLGFAQEDDLDLYGDIGTTNVAGAEAMETDAPVQGGGGEDLYGDIDMAGAEGAKEDPSEDDLTPESIAELLKNPETLQPLLEKHPQLLAVLQQSLNA